MNDATSASPASHWRRRQPRANPLEAAQAIRQGEITRLAFLMLGREGAIAFLNTDHPSLGGRPLAIAIASSEGRDGVEAELGRMSFRQPAADP
ncbi:MAG TPA: hypothetical protein VL100_10920 [Croceibacterium sp.]|nr:hypothetical protein [Croceibacterium sp.]